MQLVYNELTKNDILLLMAFRDKDTLVMPDIDLDKSEVIKTVNSLRRKNYIIGERPLRLTAKGKRYLKEYNHNISKGE